MQQDNAAITSRLLELEAQLKAMDLGRINLVAEISALQQTIAKANHAINSADEKNTSINDQSSVNERITLFRSLFRGREDVYPKLWVSKKTGDKMRRV